MMDGTASCPLLTAPWNDLVLILPQIKPNSQLSPCACPHHPRPSRQKALAPLYPQWRCVSGPRHCPLFQRRGGASPGPHGQEGLSRDLNWGCVGPDSELFASLQACVGKGPWWAVRLFPASCWKEGEGTEVTRGDRRQTCRRGRQSWASRRLWERSQGQRRWGRGMRKESPRRNVPWRRRPTLRRPWVWSCTSVRTQAVPRADFDT